jgi:hypothetical protein
MTLAAMRCLLRASGYAPIPVTGKLPACIKWQELTNASEDEIESWSARHPQSTNTGILTRLTPAIDIDITNEAAAEAIEALARERFEERGYFLVRVGKAPKRAILLRTDAPFRKLKDRHAWTVVQRHCPSKSQCREIVKTWVKNGVLYRELYRDPLRRADQTGLKLAHVSPFCRGRIA